MSDILSTLFEKYHFSQVLDLGAGEGHQALFAAKHGAHVIAVDRQSRPEACIGVDRVDWIQSPIHEYVIPQEVFDLVILRNVIHFLKRDFFITHLAPNIVRSLRPGGWLYLATFDMADVVFGKNTTGFYTTEALKAAFQPLDFQEPILETLQDNHPPYGEHQHFVVKYLGQKP